MERRLIVIDPDDLAVLATSGRTVPGDSMVVVDRVRQESTGQCGVRLVFGRLLEEDDYENGKLICPAVCTEDGRRLTTWLGLTDASARALKEILNEMFPD